MYLSVFLARSGVCSRRNAAVVIKEGSVVVNGTIELNPAYEVQTHDRVMYDGRRVALAAPMYVILNKPRGVVTTCSDNLGRRTVIDLIKLKSKATRLYPVGRLDKETTGVLLITNDGDCAQQMAHPKYKVTKTYRALLDKPFDSKAFEVLKKGIYLHDGRFVPDRLFYPKRENKFEVGLTIHSGKYRIIRRAFYRLGFEVKRLDRTHYGPFTTKGLKRGEWRTLEPSEVEQLRGKK